MSDYSLYTSSLLHNQVVGWGILILHHSNTWRRCWPAGSLVQIQSTVRGLTEQSWIWLNMNNLRCNRRWRSPSWPKALKGLDSGARWSALLQHYRDNKEQKQSPVSYKRYQKSLAHSYRSSPLIGTFRFYEGVESINFGLDERKRTLPGIWRMGRWIWVLHLLIYGSGQSDRLYQEPIRASQEKGLWGGVQEFDNAIRNKDRWQVFPLDGIFSSLRADKRWGMPYLRFHRRLFISHHKKWCLCQILSGFIIILPVPESLIVLGIYEILKNK